MRVTTITIVERAITMDREIQERIKEITPKIKKRLRAITLQGEMEQRPLFLF